MLLYIFMSIISTIIFYIIVKFKINESDILINFIFFLICCVIGLVWFISVPIIILFLLSNFIYTKIKSNIG